MKVLERKPGALRNGAPFRDWDLPGPVARLRDGLLKKSGGDRQFVEILCAAQWHSLDAVAVACELALEQQTPSAAAVLNLLVPAPVRPAAGRGHYPGAAGTEHAPAGRSRPL